MQHQPTTAQMDFPAQGGTVSPLSTLDFELPEQLHASEPAEARGLSRDEVRLMVSYRSDDRVIHTQFTHIDQFLQPGDVLVLNTSGTMNAALPATLSTAGTLFELHLSTQLPAHLWVVEIRQLDPQGTTRPHFEAQAGEVYQLPAGGRVTLLAAYMESRRLWVATFALPGDLKPYLETHGFPIRYSYVKEGWPISYYQTAYATESGSAEMPSAGRAFTAEVITRLVAQGVQVAPLILHTGVASLETHERPYEEYYRVPAHTARMVNLAHSQGSRVIAVGTTVVRALETVTDESGVTHAGYGWTELMITPERGLRSVNGMLTGMHEPRATHLLMLEALAGKQHLLVSYAHALELGYLWHEFGDLHLLLP